MLALVLVQRRGRQDLGGDGLPDLGLEQFEHGLRHGLVE